MDRREILERWAFPYIQHYGVTLVARGDARACIARIYAESCRFFGYDAFALRPDNTIQPHGEWSPDWSKGGPPALQEVIWQLRDHPPEITHYEFVFNDDL